jgi:hypothetical protein
MFLQINDSTAISNSFLILTFKRIINTFNSVFESKNDFKILSLMRAYDLIIELKESTDPSEIYHLKIFNKTFLKRIKVLSWICRTILIISILYLMIEIISQNHTVKDFFDKTGSVLKILGLFGISQLWNLLPFVKKITYKYLLIIFGYPRALINDSLNQTEIHQSS